jgi:hypothetical protein
MILYRVSTCIYYSLNVGYVKRTGCADALGRVTCEGQMKCTCILCKYINNSQDALLCLCIIVALSIGSEYEDRARDLTVLLTLLTATMHPVTGSLKLGFVL